MKAIVEFFWDFGRSGEVSGLFICEEEDLNKIIGRDIYFGEILGKHSEVSGTISSEDFVIKSTDQDFISKFIEIMGDGTISGYNPFDYIEEEDLEEPEC